MKWKSDLLTITEGDKKKNPIIITTITKCFILIQQTAAAAVRRSLTETYLLRCGHEVDGGVVAVVLLRQAEGELVVDEQRVCLKWSGRRCGGDYKREKRRKKLHQSSLKVTQEQFFFFQLVLGAGNFPPPLLFISQNFYWLSVKDLEILVCVTVEIKAALYCQC